MDEKNKEEMPGTSLDTLTKEEVLDTIKSVFKDNEESLKYIDNIINNLVELKRLSVANPTSTISCDMDSTNLYYCLLVLGLITKVRNY